MTFIEHYFETATMLGTWDIAQNIVPTLYISNMLGERDKQINVIKISVKGIQMVQWKPRGGVPNPV